MYVNILLTWQNNNNNNITLWWRLVTFPLNTENVIGKDGMLRNRIENLK